MAEKIVFETEVKTGNSGTSIKSVKRELTELKGLMSSLDMESEEFTRAATKAAKLKDQINDANDAMRNFDPGARFTTFTTVLGGVANGFSAAQGAMAIFGGESEELEKVMVRTQGAIALATGLNGLQGMWGQLTIVANVIKTQVVAAFATMRAAIISTGILGLVVLIGTLIYSWMEETKANEEATKELERFGEAQRKLLDQEQKIQIEREKGRNKEILQASAETQAKIREYQKELSEKIITQEEFSKLLAGEQEFMRIKVADINKKYDEEEQKQREDAQEKRKQLAEKEKERLKKLRDDEQKAFDERMARLKLELEANSAVSNAKLQQSKAEYEQVKTNTDQQVTELEKLKKTGLDYASNEKNTFKDRKETLDEYLKSGIISQKEYSDASIKISEEEQQAKISGLQQTSAALNNFAQLAGQQTAAGKALGVASATIDTYVAAGSAYAAAAKIDPIVLAPLAAAGAVAAGLARVKAILSVKVPGGSGGSGGSMPSAPPSVPQFNPAVAQQVQGGGDVQLGMKPQKVYVVESDIRGTMNKVDVIEANATIG
jgi:hypothetical protein